MAVDMQVLIFYIYWAFQRFLYWSWSSPGVWCWLGWKSKIWTFI